MRKNNSLPELNAQSVSVSKYYNSGWMTNKKMLKFDFSALEKHNIDVLNLRATASIF